MAQPEQNALLSVFDKTGIEEFAEGLAELDWTLYSSGGTARRIGEAGIPVTDVADLVGGEAILGHRVVTLSREIHAGLLADPSNEEHMADLERENIPFIDLVCVDMYPLEAAIADHEATPESVRESTDIGGPSMLRSAVKGQRIVLSDASQREPALAWLRSGQPDSEDYRKVLAAIAERTVASYVNTSALYLDQLAGLSASGAN